MECPSTNGTCPSSPALGERLRRIRPWVQTLFLGVWLAPLGQWLHGLPSCVFHCYSCPLSSFACPVGVLANYAALLPACHEAPYLLIGMLVVVAALGGSLACGWACPFGFVQDLLGKASSWKMRLPAWTGYFRYVVLVGLVLVAPAYFASKGLAFDDQKISICRLCPAGALEAGLPYSVQALLHGKGWMMSGLKSGILIGFVAAALFIHRPWCRLFCPLGGFLALFNRISLFHLRFKARECVECNLCRTRCAFEVKLDRKANVTGCVRCLECTACGAMEPAFANPLAASPGAPASTPTPDKPA
jgi:ferredoxin-type protein NapH